MSYENFYDRGSKSGWDDCTSDRYYWYVKYDKSVVERLFLQKDSPCGSNMEKWAQECAVSRLEQCDPSGNNCVVSIEDGQNTGQMPDLNYLTKVLQGVFTESTSTSCAYVYDYTNDYWYWSCPTGEICVSGSCPASAVMLSSPSSSSMQIGEGHANFSLSSDQAQVSYDKYLYFKDPRVCQDFAGSLDNYVICLKYYSIDLNDSAGRKTLTKSSETAASSYSYYGALIHQKRVYGGPDVPDHLNNWRSRVTFGCEETTDTCQALRDQGCVPYKTTCLDNSCDQLRYTYHCGGTGGVKSYQVAYNCLGEIKCLGTECTDASYKANTDFAAVAAAMEVLNNYRADATSTEIFPGEVQTCQKSPKNCCKSPGGLSIGDYVKAGKAALSAYSMYSGGLSATWAGYANAFTYALTEGSAGSLQGLLGTTVSDYLGTTTTTLYTSPSFYTEQLSQSMSYLTEIGVDVAQTEGGAALTASTELVSALATVATVVCIALVIYSIASLIYDFVFQCTKDDVMTSYKTGMSLCHEVGSRCSDKALGVCIKKEKVYCCFNTLLARVLHEQARPQIGKGWGGPENPDCSGFSPGELASIDFSRVDLREYLQYIQHQTEISPDKMQEILNKAKQDFQK